MSGLSIGDVVNGAPMPATGLPPWLSELQPAGNQALSMLMGTQLQRQDTATAEPGAEAPVEQEEEEGPLLDPAQIVKAKRFYTAQPWLYTKDIMIQLRTALGLPAEGGADEALVLAVARWQATEGSGDPALKVDGMAGPRTLPRIFRGGLNVVGEGKAFGEQVQTGVIDEWARLATPEARLTKLVELINATLATHGVPAVTQGFDSNQNNAGSFDFGPWTMLIGRNKLGGESISEEDARDVSQTVYHEARHTEQWFRMAQLRAGQGLSAAGIARELGIPADIATAARARPLVRGSMEAVIAQGWWESVYGSGAANREAVLKELDAASDALRAARNAHNANPTDGTQAALDAAVARRRRAFDAYRNLPEENDAWATEPEAGQGITSGSPEPDEAGPAPAPGPTGEGLEEPAGSPPPRGQPSHEVLPEANLP